MRIAFVADINSANFRNFLRYYEDIGVDFIVLSTSKPLKKVNFNIVSLPTLLPKNRTFGKEYRNNDNRLSFTSIVLRIANKYRCLQLSWALSLFHY